MAEALEESNLSGQIVVGSLVSLLSQHAQVSSTLPGLQSR